MKKLALLTMIVSLFSLNFAFAEEYTTEALIPAASLEEMLDAGADFDDTASIDFIGDRDHGYRRGVECVARNLRGHRFEARGFSPREAQQRAMHQCRRVSRQCFPLGCRRG